MGTIIGSIVAAVATAAASVICLKVSKNRQRREAEADVEKARKKIADEKDEMREAIFEKNDDKVNAKVARLLAGCFLAAVTIGCQADKTRVEYVAADRRIVSITNEWGVSCKAVPDIVFAEITDKLIELEALKKETAVDKRVGQ